MPAIFIGISLATFFAFTNPIYNDIFKLQAQVVSYNEALGNSKMLENERDKLTSKYNSIDPNNLMKLAKFLPGNIDNIRLILEIEQIASPFGMVLKDVKYNTTIDKNAASGTLGSPQGVVVQSLRKDYGVWDLEFSTVSTYNNFIDPVFSNLALDNNGNVLFDLEFSVDPSFVDYKQMLENSSWVLIKVVKFLWWDS